MCECDNSYIWVLVTHSYAGEEPNIYLSGLLTKFPVVLSYDIEYSQLRDDTSSNATCFTDPHKEI